MKTNLAMLFWLKKIFSLTTNWWAMGIWLVGLTFILGRLPVLTQLQLKTNQQLAAWQTAVTQQLTSFFRSVNLNQEEEIIRLKQENNLLKQQLAKQENPSSHLVLSYPYRLITNGNQQELKIGSMVMAEGTLLGLISQASVYAARVTLLSDLNSQPILAVTDSGVKSLVKGDGRDVLLTEVPHQLSLKVGEKVWTAGQIDIAPGLLIGFVDQLITEATDAVQTAKISQPVNFNNLAEVEVH